MSMLTFTVNGKSTDPLDIPDDMMLIDVLHEYLNLTGTRLGCGQGICHACTVLIDNADGSSSEVRTCITGAHFFNGKQIRTVEAHAVRDADGRIVKPSPVQQAFAEHFAFQCGYCTPGFVTAATALVERLAGNPIARDDVEATISAALAPHICRCTGYVRYYQAVKDVIVNTKGLVR
jgi:xanthine dehydrogenase YagT iron-sulfur-binding subunit